MAIFIDDNLGNAIISNDNFTYVTSVAALNNLDMSVVADIEKN